MVGVALRIWQAEKHNPLPIGRDLGLADEQAAGDNSYSLTGGNVVAHKVAVGRGGLRPAFVIDVDKVLMASQSQRAHDRRARTEGVGGRDAGAGGLSDWHGHALPGRGSRSRRMLHWRRGRCCRLLEAGAAASRNADSCTTTRQDETEENH